MPGIDSSVKQYPGLDCWQAMYLFQKIYILRDNPLSNYLYYLLTENEDGEANVHFQTEYQILQIHKKSTPLPGCLFSFKFLYQVLSVD